MENKEALPDWMTVHDGGLANEDRPPRRGGPGGRGGGGGDMTDLTERVGALEETLRRLEPLIVRIDEQLRITLPTLATKTELEASRAEAQTDRKDMRVALETEIKGSRTGLETRLSESRTDLKAEVQDLRTAWNATVPALATKAEVQESKADFGGETGREARAGVYCGDRVHRLRTVRRHRSRHRSRPSIPPVA